MKKQLEQLKEFHKAMFSKTGDYRADTNNKLIVGNPTAQLRANLILEEAAELADALLYENADNIRKEAADLLYVLLGTVVVYNLPLEEDFDLVHENNMLKFKTGYLGAGGKWMKSVDHPKVTFKKALEQFEMELPMPDPKDIASVCP